MDNLDTIQHSYKIHGFRWMDWTPKCYINPYKVFPNARFGTCYLVIMEKGNELCYFPVSDIVKFGKEYNMVIAELETNQVY